jgi:hypothetical protein
MKLNRFISISLVYLGLAFANAAYAFDMGNMMNPSKWMDSNKDNDRDDYYDEPGYGYPGPPQATMVAIQAMAMVVRPVTAAIQAMAMVVRPVTVAIPDMAQPQAMAVLPHTVHREPNPKKQKSCA